jgi:peptidoglycan hydrolase-like protein with peptidoglycan-binding domain
MKSYKLTSPPMRGKDVTTAQHHLAKNKFGENYHPGKADGVFGENTAGAAYRAKFALGYPKKQLTRTYGQVLDNYLTGKTKLPDAYAKRRKDRKRQARQTPMRVKALNTAKQQIGIKESPPNSNRCKFTAWYGIVGPWCAMFATFCYVNAGSKVFVKGRKFSYVPYILSAARYGGQGLSITNNPQPGDLVIFDWDRNGNPDHVGLFEKWAGGGNFNAIEGNTGSSNYSNGGAVMRTTRNRSMATITFVHVAR